MALIGAAIGYLFARSAVGGVIIAGVIALVYMAVIIGQSTDVVMNMNNAREIHSPGGTSIVARGRRHGDGSASADAAGLYY